MAGEEEEKNIRRKSGEEEYSEEGENEEREESEVESEYEEEGEGEDEGEEEEEDEEETGDEDEEEEEEAGKSSRSGSSSSRSKGKRASEASSSKKFDTKRSKVDQGKVGSKAAWKKGSAKRNTISRRQEKKEENVAALIRGNLVVERRTLLPKILSVSNDPAVVLRRPFKSPCPGANSSTSQELLRRLSASRQFVPWGGKPREPFPLGIPQVKAEEGAAGSDAAAEEEGGKQEGEEEGVEPLVLWTPEDDPVHATANSTPILVDPKLTKFLRPHQREGVQFMFECVAGLRKFHKSEDGGEDDPGCFGCILADDMGLGKTLQSITLLWTLLRSGFDGPGKPMARRAIVVTPTSLVSNWESELAKWLNGQVSAVALCEASRADVISGIAQFLSPRSRVQVLIISYETFRLHAERFKSPSSCDLLICDEAHRLKNDKTLTTQALSCLSCRRRVLLSGTPMQNDLEEFFAMVSFTNPGILGDASQFRKHFQAPIVCGREPYASEEERLLGAERSSQLSDKVNEFILRRTNALLSNHLPPKIVEIVCCSLTDLQTQLYERFIHSKNVQKAINDNRKARVLASITALKKLCNHPKLIYDTIRAGGAEAAGFEDCLSLFPQYLTNERSGAWTGGGGAWVELSGKMLVLSRLLAYLRRSTSDRIVLVSNYTQTLDLFAQLCRERNYPFVRLDGSTSIGKRQKLVQQFNDQSQNQFAFLLSSKAGGCGLNLIGGNRLVLFDPDWNPATDKQAAARVWRDGQRKRVFVYRFLAAGTIEEKVYQRQISKEGLQKVVDNDGANDERAQANFLSSEDLRDLFTLKNKIGSDTHETLNCIRCNAATGAAADVTSTGVTESTCVVGQDGDEGSGDVDGVRQGEAGGEWEKGDIGGFVYRAGLQGVLKPWQKQVGSPLEEQLDKWGHHSTSVTVPDMALQMAGGSEVSFVFTCMVHGKLKPIESELPLPDTTTIGTPKAMNRSTLTRRSQVMSQPIRMRQAGPRASWQTPPKGVVSTLPKKQSSGVVSITRKPSAVDTASPSLDGRVGLNSSAIKSKEINSTPMKPPSTPESLHGNSNGDISTSVVVSPARKHGVRQPRKVAQPKLGGSDLAEKENQVASFEGDSLEQRQVRDIAAALIDLNEDPNECLSEARLCTGQPQLMEHPPTPVQDVQQLGVPGSQGKGKRSARRKADGLATQKPREECAQSKDLREITMSNLDNDDDSNGSWNREENVTP